MIEIAMHKNSNRRAGIYVAVLGTSMAVMIIGASALTLARVERRSSEGLNDLAQARLHAHSAIEIGRRMIYTDPQWRTNLPNGAWRTEQQVGTGGKYSLSANDPSDANLADSKAEPVELTGTGTSNRARYILHTTMIAEPTPLNALKKALVSNGEVQINLLRSLSVTGAPLATNARVNNLGTLAGSVESVLVNILGALLGPAPVTATPLAMPDAEVIAMYKNMATTIPFTGDIDNRLIGPSHNPWGAPNPEGVYYIDSGDSDIRFRSTRLLGTLIVKTGNSRKLLIDNANFFRSANPSYPVLIVDGNAEIKASTVSLTESGANVNFNPTGAEYLGTADIDKTDSYPNEVQGLVHIKRNLVLSETSKLRGVVIVEGTTTVNGTVEIIHDPKIYNDSPLGYATYQMKVSQGSWTSVILP